MDMQPVLIRNDAKFHFEEGELKITFLIQLKKS